MNLVDLRIFVSAASLPTLAAAALEMHLTPSAVSKALRRLEESLGTPLFDRSAKLLVLNDAGRRLLGRAQNLLALAEQARCDVMGERAQVDCRVGGPPILLWRHGNAVAQALSAYLEATVRFTPIFEDEALAALARGDLNAAIVTGAVIKGRGQHWSPEWEATPLGALSLHLVAHRKHPLARQAAKGAVSAEAVLQHDFASPTRSMFCGEQRGSHSDGWREDRLPRRIRYWTDDLHLLLGLVKSGAALAYLPDFAASESELVKIEVSDGAFECKEQVWLVWNRSNAGPWQKLLADELATPSPM